MRFRFANVLSWKEEVYREKILPSSVLLYTAFLSKSSRLPVVAGNEQGSGQRLLDAYPIILLAVIW